MATEKKKGVEGVKDGFDDIMRAQRAAALETSRAARMTAKLSKAMDEASNGAIDKVSESFKELIESTSILSDKQKEELKSHKLTVTTITRLTQKLLDAQDKIEAFSKARAEDVKKLKVVEAAIQKQKLAGAAVDEKLVEERKALNDDLCASLKKLGVKTTDAVKAIDAVAAESKAHAAAINGFTGNLSSSSSKIGKVMDGMRSKMLDNIGKMVSVGYALEQLGEAAQVVYKQTVRLANKGLMGSMMQINKSAIMLRMSAEEFEAVIDANRDVVASLGGGTKGIEDFQHMMRDATVGLEYLGKDGVVAATKMFKAFYDTGFSTLNSDKNAAKVYTNNVKALNKQFSMFQGNFGDTADQFADFYKQMLSSSSIQAKLNAGDTKGLDLQFKEIMARTEQLRLMHLTNDEVVELNKRFEDSFNPRKNDQAQAQVEKEYALQSMYQTAIAAKASGKDDGSADKLLEAIQNGSFREAMGKSKQGQEDFAAKNPELMKALSKVYSVSDELRDQTGGRTSVANFGGIFASEHAGVELSKWLSTGDTFNTAGRRGAQDQKSQADLKEQGLKNVGKDMNGDYTAAGVTFNALRATVDQVTSTMANPFIKALWAATAALVAFGGAKGALGLLSGLIGSIGKGGIGEAGAVAGRGVLGSLAVAGGGGAAGLATASVGVAAAGAVGVGAGLLINKVIEGTTFQETLGRVITKVLGTLGLDDDADKKIDAVQAANAALASVNAKASRRSSGTVTNESSMPYASATSNPKIAKPSTEIMGAIKQASTTAGVDPAYMLAMANQESSFNPNAKAGTSSAKGLYQFTNGTWAAMVKKYGAQYGIGMNDQYDPQKNALMGALFTKDNQSTLQSQGLNANATSLYAAHVLGANGAVSLLKAKSYNPSASAAAMMPDAANANRSMFYNKDGTPKSISDVYDFFDKKVGSQVGTYNTMLQTQTSTASSKQPADQLNTPTVSKPLPPPTQDQLNAPTTFASITGPSNVIVPPTAPPDKNQPDATAVASAKQQAPDNAPTTSQTKFTADSADTTTGSKAVVDELKAHTSLLNTMVALLGRGSPPSSRAFLLDQHAALAAH